MIASEGSQVWPLMKGLLINIVLKQLYLNGNILGFYPSTQKLESPWPA